MKETAVTLLLQGFEKDPGDGLMIEVTISPVSTSFLRRVTNAPANDALVGSFPLEEVQMREIVRLLERHITSKKFDLFVRRIPCAENRLKSISPIS